MIKLFTLPLLMLALLFAPSGYAANPNLTDPPADRADALTSKMISELDIEAEKREELYALNLKYAHRVTYILNSSSFKFRKIAQLKAMSSEKDEELEKLLSPAQMERYEEMKVGLKKEAEQKLDAALATNTNI